MNLLVKLAERLYDGLVVVFPASYRTEFEEEMRETFRLAVRDIPQGEWRRLLMLLLREVCDLPAALWREHLAVMKGFDMSKIDVIGLLINHVDQRQPASWWEAILAGLPNFIMGVLMGLGKLSVLDAIPSSETAAIIIGASWATLIIVVLIIAAMRGWPLWSASWYLYGSWVITAALELTIEQLNIYQSWHYYNAIILVWIVVCIFSYCLIVKKSKLHGLLSIAFFFPLVGLMMLEFIPDPIEGWLVIGTGLLAALAVGAIVRLGDLNLALGIVLGFNFIAGLAWAYISEYQMFDLPLDAPLHVPSFTNFLIMLTVYSLIGSGIIALPFILHGVWRLGRRKFIS